MWPCLSAHAAGRSLFRSFGHKIKLVAVPQQAAGHVDDFLHVAVQVGDALQEGGSDVGVVALDAGRGAVRAAESPSPWPSPRGLILTHNLHGGRGSNQPVVMSDRWVSPRQRVLMPGGPSPLRPKWPPSLPIS